MNDYEFHDKVIDSLARIETEQKSMNKRLFGGEGQEGVISYLAKELKINQNDITEIKQEQALTKWKVGSVSAVLGAGMYGLGKWISIHLMK